MLHRNDFTRIIYQKYVEDLYHVLILQSRNGLSVFYSRADAIKASDQLYC